MVDEDQGQHKLLPLPNVSVFTHLSSYYPAIYLEDFPSRTQQKQPASVRLTDQGLIRTWARKEAQRSGRIVKNTSNKAVGCWRGIKYHKLLKS